MYLMRPPNVEVEPRNKKKAKKNQVVKNVNGLDEEEIPFWIITYVEEEPGNDNRNIFFDRLFQYERKREEIGNTLKDFRFILDLNLVFVVKLNKD